MAYTLKLNVYKFSLYRITKTIERQMRGDIRIKYETESNAISFNAFAKSIDSIVTRDSYLPIVFQSIVTFFDSRFRVNALGTKAVSITTPPKPSYNTLGYVINGMFKGGDTGIGKIVYSQQNAIQPGTRISNTDVPVNNYYYKLWIPYDGEDGVLMIQSYTDMGCTVAFRDQIEEFFISKGFHPNWNTMIPSGFIGQYLNRSFINQIKVVYTTEQKREQGVFASLTSVKKEGWLKNINIPLGQLFVLPNYKQKLQNKIMEFIDYDQNHDMVKVFYVDETGKKASASIDSLEKVLPSIILPDELKCYDTDEPNFEEISRYTEGILDEIKRQIGYTIDELV